MQSQSSANSTVFVIVDDAGSDQITPLMSRICSAMDDLRIIRRELFSAETSSGDSLSELVQGLVKPPHCEQYGVILDLRLDGVAQKNGRTFANFGTSVAQEIRSRETFSGTDWCYPVVLLSMETVFQLGYQRDRTGRDLFDLAEKKENLNQPSATERFSRRLLSLADGYSRLRKWTDDDGFGLLGNLPNGVFISPEIRRRLRLDSRPRHDFAQFLLRDLLEIPGPLIEQEYVLARLGVDLAASEDDGARLLSQLDPYKYIGIFAEGWPRWWAGAIEDWWSVHFKKERPLRMLSANQRVNLLRAEFGLEKLQAALPIHKNHGQNFWVVCAATQRPLDLVDAVKVHSGPLASWQEHRFVNIVAAIRSTDLPLGVELHPSEESRIAYLRKQEEGNPEDLGEDW